MHNGKILGGIQLSLLAAIIVLALALFSASAVQAATLTFASSPDGSVRADQTYTYAVHVAGAVEGTVLSYTLTNAPQGMSISADGVITWEPTKAGIYRFVVGVSDTLDNHLSKPIRLNVLPGELVSMQIEPNQNPTTVKLGSTQTFAVKGFDAEGNAVDMERVEWSVAGNIGSINSAGVLTPARQASGKVSAQLGTHTATIDVSTTGSAQAPLAPQGSVLGATTDDTQSDTPATDAVENTAVSTTESADDTAPCINWKNWILLGILIVYAAVLIWYFQLMKKRPSPLWWLFPVLLTVIGLIVYAKYICEGTYTWWPWVMLAIGVILTILYKPKASQPV